ncbi:hypothetical protein [Corallococcus sp. AB030]|uniref:hypothetical protein n=1 Tax=Corallococcus sp. AB030 TaxID=2316716 RepID=UPI0011E5E5EE|nr:hypothetical protein [Corallococcus sp. AB030]
MRKPMNTGQGGTSQRARGGGGASSGARAADNGWETGRVGPFVVKQRVAHDTEHGDVYLASNGHTGHAALGVRPTADQVDGDSPCSWSARVESLNGQAFVEVLTIQAPASVSPADVCEEIAVTLGDLSNVVDQVRRKPVVLDHLMAPPVPRWRRQIGRARRRLASVRLFIAAQWKNAALVGLTASLLLAVGVRQGPSTPEKPKSAMPEPERAVLTTGIAETSLSEIDVTPPVPVYGLDQMVRIALDMPGKPFKGQRRPPCKKNQEEIIGACWVAVKQAPPCGDDYFEHKSVCYAPFMVLSDGTEAPRPIAQ